MLLVWCVAAVVGAACTPNRRVLPIPLRVEADGCCTALSAGLVPNVTGLDAGLVLDAWLPAAASSDCASTPVTRLDVVVAPRTHYDDVTFSRWQVINESYAIDCAIRPAAGAHESSCTVRAPTAIGARYGLATLAQLYATGVGPAHLAVEDEPSHAYRGLMVDLGRRFVPMSWFDQTLAGMEAARLNTLHLHLSDFCRFALDLPEFPQVRAAQTGLLEGTYSVAEMRALVAAAARRGIRVVPEVDVPGHAQGLVPLGVETCAADAAAGGVRPEQSTQLRDTSATRDVLARLFTALREVFPESEYMHVGGDETASVGACTKEGSAQTLEVWTMARIREMKRTALVWGDLVAPTNSDVIREAWGPAMQQAGDHRVIDAQLESSYLDFPARPAEAFWRAVPMTEANVGGEAVIWTDSYCHTYQCGAASPDVAVAAGSAPRAPGLFGRAHDAEFASSLSGLVWPRAFVKGAALYRHQGVPVDTLLARAAEALALRGVDACPRGCTCDETTRCGKVYGTGEPLSCFSAVDGSSLAGAAHATPRTDRAQALRLCLWKRCTGVACAADGCVPVGDPIATPAELAQEGGAVAYVRLTNSTDPVCTGIPAPPTSLLRTEATSSAEETPERASFLRRPESTVQ